MLWPLLRHRIKLICQRNRSSTIDEQRIHGELAVGIGLVHVRQKHVKEPICDKPCRAAQCKLPDALESRS